MIQNRIDSLKTYNPGIRPSHVADIKQYQQNHPLIFFSQKPDRVLYFLEQTDQQMTAHDGKKGN